MVIVRFTEAMGEIPKGALGILRDNIMAGDIDRNRVFIPRRYTGLSADIFPCYEMSGGEGCWIEIQKEDLTEKELQELNDLDKEVADKTSLMIGPDGIIITTLGNITPDKFDKMLGKILDDLDEGEEWKQ